MLLKKLKKARKKRGDRNQPFAWGPGKKTRNVVCSYLFSRVSLIGLLGVGLCRHKP